MKKKSITSIIVLKVVGIVCLIASGIFGYVFLRVVPKLIEWISYFTFKDIIKFLLGILGEIFLGVYALIGLFIGLSLLIDMKNFLEEDDNYIQEHNKDE